MLQIALSAILINNFVLVRFLGICPFLGVSKKLDTALGMGFAVTFVMSLSCALTYLANEYLLVRMDMQYLQTIVFILIIASLVQFVEMFLQKNSKGLYSALGIYLPLITTNCAVLGVTLIVVDPATTLVNNFFDAVWYGFCAGLSFTLAIILFASIRERLARVQIPAVFQGFPIALVTASLLAIAFLGFQGLNF